MLFPPSIHPHFTVRRPSPTTAEFVVSSHPPPTLQLQALLLLWSVTRILLAATCVLFLYLNLFPISVDEVGQNTSCSDFFFHGLIFFGYKNNSGALCDTRLHDPPHTTVTNTPTSLPRSFLNFLKQVHAFIHAIVLSASSTRSLAHIASTTSPVPVIIVAAAALWLASLRVRTTESLLVLRGLGVQVQGRFIPTAKILDILINEAFLGLEVRYYLAVMVDGEDDLVVVFPTSLPGREIVEEVWRGARACLWEGGLVRRANVGDK